MKNQNNGRLLASFCDRFYWLAGHLKFDDAHFVVELPEIAAAIHEIRSSMLWVRKRYAELPGMKECLKDANKALFDLEVLIWDRQANARTKELCYEEVMVVTRNLAGVWDSAYGIEGQSKLFENSNIANMELK